jgi:hypothetical protein
MFRNQLRHGIRAVAQGRDPMGVFRADGKVIPTYCNNMVLRLPPAPSGETDKELLRATGRKLAQGYLKEPPLTVRR